MFRDRGADDQSAQAADGLWQIRRSAPATAAPVAPPRRGDPRVRLLQAMVETVALRGYERTTVSRVLSVAGLEEAVFREHFHDKRDCFAQAVDGLLCGGERAALELFEADLPWPERVRLGLERLLCALAADPAAARVLLVETFCAGPELGERRQAAVALLIALMEQGREQSANAACLPTQTSEAIVGGVLSILHRRALQGQTPALPSLRADLTYFALLPYVEHERAAAVAER